jgi:hypothetical protein
MYLGVAGPSVNCPRLGVAIESLMNGDGSIGEMTGTRGGRTLNRRTRLLKFWLGSEYRIE